MTIDSNLGKVDEVMTALYDIQDPEIGMSIVDLDLIKAVEIGADGAPSLRLCGSGASLHAH